MMLRIREAESTQAIGDLRQRIAELEVQVRYVPFPIVLYDSKFRIKN